VVGPAADSLPNQCGGWSIHWGVLLCVCLCVVPIDRDGFQSTQGAASPSEFDAYPDTSTIYQGIKSLAPSGSRVQLIGAPLSRLLAPPPSRPGWC
jgi:hypothetical protein